MSIQQRTHQNQRTQQDAAVDAPFETSALFCANCGMLLQLHQLSSSSTGRITCQFCQHQTDLNKLLESSGATIVHTKTFNQQKEWLTGPHQKKEKEKAIVEEDCPNEKCDSKRLYFWTVQLRSVDEGQTVFYECVKCGHSFKDHT